MRTEVFYIVLSPIHGYSNMGYSHLRQLRKKFVYECNARKYLRRCNKVFHMSKQDLPYLGEDAEARRDTFIREITDHHSFHFKGESKLYKQTLIEELLS